MQHDLTEAFHITATQLGVLVAFYYYPYTLMQIPAGLIYDKFGARFVLVFACLTAVLGLSIFINADSLGIASAGRFLIGLGTAFSYIGVLKLASQWLPPNRFATAAGLTTALGMTCAAVSQRYLTHVVEAIGYKNALHSSLFIGIALSVVILLIIRNQPKQKINTANAMSAPMNIKQLFSALRILLANRQTWLIGVIGCLLYLPATVFLDLWGKPYLQAVYQLTSDQAVNISSMTFLGWIVSGPIIGAFSDKIKRRRMPLVVTGAIAALLLCVVFYAPGLTLTQLYVLFVTIGFCCGAHPLCFALSKENNPSQIAGTAVAVANMLIMLGGAIFQPLVGKLLDLHTSGLKGADGLPIYSSGDYTFALSIIPLGVLFAIFLSLFLKETYCQSQVVEETSSIFPQLEPEGARS